MNTLVDITNEKIDIEKYKQLMKDPTAGAIVTFEGVTRNYFEDKVVTSLDYECYYHMAIKELQKIADDCIAKGALKVCLVHRIGVVAISEVSLICIVLSSHRKLAFELCEYSLEQIKKMVPIWKKEVYSDSKHLWKKNIN